MYGVQLLTNTENKVVDNTFWNVLKVCAKVKKYLKEAVVKGK
jgi:hypothetical protein